MKPSRSRRILVLLVLFVLTTFVAVAFIGCSDPTSDVDTTRTTAVASTATTSTPDADAPQTTPTTPGPPSAISVDALFDGEGPRDATVNGFIVWDTASARLCSVLMESFPPQCGEPSVVIANPAALDDTISLSTSQDVRWTDQPVELDGRFDGDRLILRAGASLVEPSEADHALVDAFLAHADTPTADTLAALPLAESIVLGLSSQAITTRAASDLVERSNWDMDVEEYAGFGGPFSALDVVAESPVAITIGAHRRCAGPPVDAPEGISFDRHVSIQPTDLDSCISWWSVDFFLTDGVVFAITLDLFGP